MQIFTDEAAAFFWPEASDDTLFAFIEKMRRAQRGTYDDKRYWAAIHILRKKGKVDAAGRPTGIAAAQPASASQAKPLPKWQSGAAVMSQLLGQQQTQAPQGSPVTPIAVIGGKKPNTPKAAVPAGAVAVPPLRPRPAGLPTFTKQSAEFYWPAADKATLEAFIAANLDTKLNIYDERRYFAAVHLLGLDGAVSRTAPVSSITAGAPAPPAGSGYAFCIAMVPNNAGGTSRIVVAAPVADIANGRLDPNGLPDDVEEELDAIGLTLVGLGQYDLQDDTISDAEIRRELGALGFVEDPRLLAIAMNGTP